MADVKVELKESISRKDAARWLSQLSHAFANGHEGELPFGSGTISMEIPDRVRAELEVEVEGNEVEVEIEFKWQIAEPEKAPRPSDGAQTTARSGVNSARSGVTKGRRAASRK
jgi:amphi-Trp domain-containing protein